MNAKSLTRLAIAAAVVIVAVVITKLAGDGDDELTTSGRFIEDLRERINDVETVTLTGAGGETIARLERGEDRWVVASQSGYPANFAKLKEMLFKLSESEIVEPKTSQAEYYGRLGVRDIDDEEAQGTRVTIEGLDEPIDVILGKVTRGGSSGTYVRRAGEAQSWLISERIEPDSKARNWLNRQIVDISSSQVHRVTVRHADGEEVTIQKASRDEDQFELVNKPEGRELTTEASPNRVANALANLRLEKVKPVDQIERGEPAAVTELQLFDGRTVTVNTYGEDDDTWMTFDAGYDQALAERFATNADNGGDDGADSGGEGDSDQASSAESETGNVDGEDGDDDTDAQGLAKELNETLEGWAYQVPNYRYKNLNKRLEELLKEPESEDDSEDGEQSKDENGS